MQNPYQNELNQVAEMHDQSQDGLMKSQKLEELKATKK